MAISGLNKTDLYRLSDGRVELPKDPADRQGLMWQPEHFEEFGYYPKPVVFGQYGAAAVEVYTQSADSDDAPHTFMCRVQVAGAAQDVYVDDLPSLIGLLREMAPVMQSWRESQQPPHP